MSLILLDPWLSLLKSAQSIHEYSQVAKESKIKLNDDFSRSTSFFFEQKWS